MNKLFTRSECLDSLDANNCVKVGRNRWEDETYRYRLTGRGENHSVVAERLVSQPNANMAMREALRPMFLASRA